MGAWRRQATVLSMGAVQMDHERDISDASITEASLMLWRDRSSSDIVMWSVHRVGRGDSAEDDFDFGVAHCDDTELDVKYAMLCAIVKMLL